MERQTHPTFGRRLFASILALFITAMIAFGIGIIGELKYLPLVRTVGFCGFLGCVVGMFVLAWRRSQGCFCPRCSRWLNSNPARDREESLKFICSECGIEWDTKGSIDL